MAAPSVWPSQSALQQLFSSLQHKGDQTGGDHQETKEPVADDKTPAAAPEGQGSQNPLSGLTGILGPVINGLGDAIGKGHGHEGGGDTSQGHPPDSGANGGNPLSALKDLIPAITNTLPKPAGDSHAPDSGQNGNDPLSALKGLIPAITNTLPKPAGDSHAPGSGQNGNDPLSALKGLIPGMTNPDHKPAGDSHAPDSGQHGNDPLSALKGLIPGIADPKHEPSGGSQNPLSGLENIISPILNIVKSIPKDNQPGANPGGDPKGGPGSGEPAPGGNTGDTNSSQTLKQGRLPDDQEKKYLQLDPPKQAPGGIANGWLKGNSDALNPSHISMIPDLNPIPKDERKDLMSQLKIGVTNPAGSSGGVSDGTQGGGSGNTHGLPGGAIPDVPPTIAGHTHGTIGIPVHPAQSNSAHGQSAVGSAGAADSGQHAGTSDAATHGNPGAGANAAPKTNQGQTPNPPPQQHEPQPAPTQQKPNPGPQQHTPAPAPH